MKIILFLCLLLFQNYSFGIAYEINKKEKQITFINHFYDLEIARMEDIEKKINKAWNFEKNIRDLIYWEARESYLNGTIYNPNKIIADYIKTMEIIQNLGVCPSKTINDLEYWQGKIRHVKKHRGPFVSTGNRTVSFSMDENNIADLQKKGMSRPLILQKKNCYHKMRTLHLTENIDKKIGYLKAFGNDLSYKNNYQNKPKKIINLFNKKGELEISALISGILKKDIEKIFLNYKPDFAKNKKYFFDVIPLFQKHNKKNKEKNSLNIEFYKFKAPQDVVSHRLNIDLKFENNGYILSMTFNFPTLKILKSSVNKIDAKYNAESIYNNKYSNEKNLKRCREFLFKIKNDKKTFKTNQIINKELEKCIIKIRKNHS